MIDPSLLAAISQNPEGVRDRVMEALAERAAADERLRPLLEMMQHQANDQGEDESPSPSRRATIERVRTRVAQMRDELRRVSRINARLSAALGACAVCWGEDPECDTCGGDGTPGWRRPHSKLFRTLVAPAVARTGGAPESETTNEEENT